MREFGAMSYLTFAGAWHWIKRHWRGVTHDVVFYTGALVWLCIGIFLLSYLLGG